MLVRIFGLLATLAATDSLVQVEFAELELHFVELERERVALSLLGAAKLVEERREFLEEPLLARPADDTETRPSSWSGGGERGGGSAPTWLQAQGHDPHSRTAAAGPAGGTADAPRHVQSHR